jgi:hypothetical protein
MITLYLTSVLKRYGDHQMLLCGFHPRRAEILLIFACHERAE